MWTPRALIMLAVVAVMAGLVLTSSLDTTSKIVSLVALSIAIRLVLRRR